MLNFQAWVPFPEGKEITFYQMSLSLSAVILHMARCVCVSFQEKLKKKRWGRVRTSLPHTLIPNGMGSSSTRNFYSSTVTLTLFHYLVFRKWTILSSVKPAESGKNTIKTLVLMINKFSAKYFSLFNYFTSHLFTNSSKRNTVEQK